MEINEKLFKALANQTRLDILRWLKDPLTHIDVVTCETVQYELDHFGGICVGDIVRKAGLAQSTISSYLAMLEEVGLLTYSPPAGTASGPTTGVMKPRCKHWGG
ncbi:Transcriptional regulator, ArsR family [Limosilactobacillus fermentum]|nr:Transcriptional regulator, ArsR family [Limosilactobacillus fermentum]SJM61291.1 Transcriptional regulator, ArsR family [Limosilactobacillus fermentum]